MESAEQCRCSACGAANAAARRFCAQCGAALPLACAACGFANEPSARFCGGCGTALPMPGAEPARAQPCAEAERRPVTVLFADLCGYTRLSEQVDPEDMHRLLQSFFGAVDALVERSGGRVDKHIGDAVMAVYGAPIARGDESLRAVQAARAIVDATAALTARAGQPVRVHIGIAAGEVVASDVGSGLHSAYTVVGPSVNLAARLTDIAAPGEIVVDDAVHAAVSASTECIALQDLAIKGIERPVRAWRIVAFDVEATRTSKEPLVGRRHELAQLAGVIRTCTATGSGSVIYVRGDPGIGKSRLVTETMRVATTEGYACQRALVLDSGIARDRDAMRDVITGLLDLAPASTQETRQRALTDARDRGWLSAEHEPFIADLLDVPLPAAARALYHDMELAARQRGLIQALTHLVAAASAAVPRVIAIEDLHWADARTLAHVAGIAKAVSRAPLVLMVTSRVDGDPLAGPWRAALHGVSLTTLDLGPLSDAEAQALAGGLIATSERFARKCVERAGGNPLFLTQLLRAAQEHEDRLPASLQSVVLARVDRLPERDRVALRAASVIGQRFSEAVVRHLTGMPDFRCDGLLEHRLVQPDGEDFLFSHALIRDGVYASLTRTRRAALHLQAAQWYGDRDPALRAEHLDRAESPEAASAYLHAAELEAAALRIDRALSLAERGLALATEAPERCALELLRGRVFREIGEGRRVSEAGRAALASASTPAEQCRALLTIAAGHRFTGEVDVALDALAQAESLAQGDDLARERMQIHYLRGNLHFAHGRIDACRLEHARAHDDARALRDTEHEARALSGLGDAAYAQGLMRTALERFAACVALCDAHGLVRIALPNRIMFGNCRMFLGEFDAAVADVRAAGDMAIRLGDRHAEMMALESEGLILHTWGHFAEAVAVNTRARELAEQIGARRYASIIILQLAEAMLQQGRHADARRELQVAMTYARETGIAFAGPMILGLLARLADEPDERAAHVAEAEALLAAACLSHNHLFYRRFAIDDALARRDLDQALRHAEALERYANAEPVPYVDLLVRRARACVARARDPHDVRAAEELLASRSEAERLDWRLTWPEDAVRA